MPLVLTQADFDRYYAEHPDSKIIRERNSRAKEKLRPKHNEIRLYLEDRMGDLIDKRFLLLDFFPDDIDLDSKQILNSESLQTAISKIRAFYKGTDISLQSKKVGKTVTAYGLFKNDDIE